MAAKEMYISFKWWIPYFLTFQIIWAVATNASHHTVMQCRREGLPGERQPLFPCQASLTQALSRRPQTGSACRQPERHKTQVISLKGSPSTTVHNEAANTYRTHQTTIANDPLVMTTIGLHFASKSSDRRWLSYFFLFYLPRGFLVLEYSAVLSSQEIGSSITDWGAEQRGQISIMLIPPTGIKLPTSLGPSTDS